MRNVSHPTEVMAVLDAINIANQRAYARDISFIDFSYSAVKDCIKMHAYHPGDSIKPVAELAAELGLTADEQLMMEPVPGVRPQRRSSWRGVVADIAVEIFAMERLVGDDDR